LVKSNKEKFSFREELRVKRLPVIHYKRYLLLHFVRKSCLNKHDVKKTKFGHQHKGSVQRQR